MDGLLFEALRVGRGAIGWLFVAAVSLGLLRVLLLSALAVWQTRRIAQGGKQLTRHHSRTRLSPSPRGGTDASPAKTVAERRSAGRYRARGFAGQRESSVNAEG
ncbi:MAG: hypothetical protein B7Z14_02125 [Bosea sp. 32-68-6]|nr:MAG: hypothetical protein B7Z14_02125 [Bosea sp. 32-68-6]